MKQQPKWKSVLANIALVVIMAALVLPFFSVDFIITRWVYCAGAAVYLVARILMAGDYGHLPLRQRRLHRLEVWSAIFFTAAAVLMFLRTVGHTDWVAFTLAGAVLVVYANFMLVRAQKQEE